MFSPKTLCTRILAPVLFLFALLSGVVQANDKVYQQAWNHIADGALIVDVRTPAEFAQGHLPGAINIPLPQVVKEFAARNIGKDTDVMLYCRSGNRSGQAQKALIAEGYTNTFNGLGYQGLMAHKPQK